MKRKYITLTKKEDLILFNTVKEKSGIKSDTDFIKDAIKLKARMLGITKIDIEV